MPHLAACPACGNPIDATALAVADVDDLKASVDHLTAVINRGDQRMRDLTAELNSRNAVIAAVDKVLQSVGAIHASRALAIVDLIARWDVGLAIVARDSLHIPTNSTLKLN